ncbi:hypothetical protein COCON_G00138550 [Conger conger]|uniref:Zinc finger E-box-binding homeobox 1 n=1 Tax=Conger conger TaxID=82655 RepID=A0A9Q1DFE2_CONCO|nr:hypothetical protein COCON_G00138550 [Conger conger]
MDEYFDRIVDGPAQYITHYSNAEASSNSDSDDEDKLHIVEEESLPDTTESHANANELQGGPPAHNAALTHNGDQHQALWEEEDLGPDARRQSRRFKGRKASGWEAEEEDRGTPDPLVEEDTPVLFPVAPEEGARLDTPEASGPDENGTPDAFSQLLTCPYCARGYKRYTSLKEHIKYRHEKSEDNFSCTVCSYTFAHRTQLDRHMTAHKAGREQRHVTQSGGNRKFKCSECSKAFKYKHHLKEHLRIHSGEKPYECPHCKKRFSHSGSYSSHISSKKCVGPLPINGRPRPGGKAEPCPSPCPSLPSSPAPPGRTLAPAGRTLTREKPDPGKPLQEQLPVTQIKAEPPEYEYKPVVLAPPPNGVFHGGPSLQPAPAPALVQALVLPTVGLVSPISINLGDLQSVLKVAVDGNVLRQVLESAHLNASKETGGGATATHSVISAISLPIVDQDGTTKIIINYSLEPSPVQAAQPATKKQAPPPPKAPVDCKVDTPPVEAPAPKEAESNKEAELGSGEAGSGSGEAGPGSGEAGSGSWKAGSGSGEAGSGSGEAGPGSGEAEPGSGEAGSGSGEAGSGSGEGMESVSVERREGEQTCLLCDDCPGGLDALHKLKHSNPKPGAPATANGEGPEGEGAPDIAALLSDGPAGQPALKSLLSLLKAYFALNAQPTAHELATISHSVSLPPDVVSKWFLKMRSGQSAGGGQVTVGGLPRASPPPSGDEAPPPSEGGGAGSEPPRAEPVSPLPATASPSGDEPPADTAPAQSDSQGDPPTSPSPAPSPLNLSATGLVIVKSEEEEGEEGQAEPLDLSLPKPVQGEGSAVAPCSAYSEQEEPLNLTCAKKEPPPAPLPGNTIYVTPSANPVSIVTTQIPTLVAITEQGLSCLRAVTANKQTILIPQLTYTYTTTAPAASSPRDPPLPASVLQDERLDTSSEGLEEQNDSDSTPPRKKMRKTESGMYACDLCDKIFQKSSSLLRHKYEHTGKRPHECGICSKAFKHKHHLIEHTRLHSGEKPYQCDKCGKRFSHSGSYSQHMNHRYSYCKKEAQGRQEGEEGGRAPGGADTPPLAPDQEEGDAPPSQLDSDERDEEESEEEEDEEDGVSEGEIQPGVQPLTQLSLEGKPSAFPLEICAGEIRPVNLIQASSLKPGSEAIWPATRRRLLSP